MHFAVRLHQFEVDGTLLEHSKQIHREKMTMGVTFLRSFFGADGIVSHRPVGLPIYRRK